jgi:ankyrin repeat protein
MNASLAGLPDTVQLLLKAGASLHAKDSRGETPLMHAVEKKHDDIAQILRDAGARE